MVGLANLTPLQIITHLYASYGNIDEVDLETNKTNMMQPYSMDQPIETFVEQLEHRHLFGSVRTLTTTQPQAHHKRSNTPC